MGVMNYEGECSENMQWFESYENFKLCCYGQFSIESMKGWMGVMMFDGIDEMMNGSGELWRRVQKKYVMSQIIWKLHSTKKLLLRCCYQQCFIESTKGWMGVNQYEGGCIKNISWVESYKIELN